MTYAEVVEKAQKAVRIGSIKVPFIDCKLWKRGNQINLWTYWQGYQLDNVDEKGVDILLVGQDWGNPERKENAEVCNSIKEIQDGKKDAFYSAIVSPTDKRLARMFKAFGDTIDITTSNPGMRLFFTNYSLGYRKDSETGGMTKTIMRQDKELFEDLVKAIKPKIIICLGQITFEVVTDTVIKEFSKKLKTGEPLFAKYQNSDIPVYGVAHPGSRGLYNIGGEEKIMLASWKVIADDYYTKYAKV